MTIPRMPAGMPQPQLVQVPIQRPPTAEERAEVELVRGMQVRKDAVALAVEHHRGDVCVDAVLLTTAVTIARYILGESVAP